MGRKCTEFAFYAIFFGEKMSQRFWIFSFQFLVFLTPLHFSEMKSVKETFIADFLSTKLNAYQILVFMSCNDSIEWAADVIIQRNHNEIAFYLLKDTLATSEMLPTYQDIFMLDGTKQAFVFFPETIPETEYYLRMTLSWAYKAPRMDDRLNIAVMFFLLYGQQDSLENLSKLLQRLTVKYAAGISRTQYLYPAAMDRFYIINGTDLKKNVFEVYSFGRRDYAIFHIKHVPLEKLGLFTIRRTNFEGATIAAAGLKNSYRKDIVTSYNSGTNQTKLTGGLSYNILSSLQQQLNFSLRITEYERGWNENLYNFSYEAQSMGQVLFQEREDIFIVKSTYIVQRAFDFKLLVPLHVEGLYAYFIQPNIGSNTNMFWKSLQPMTWTVLLVLLLFICATKDIINKVTNNIRQQTIESKNMLTLITDEVMWVTALVTQQGWTQVATTAPMRFLFLSSTLMALLSLVALTAKLTATLSVNTPPIESFSELIRTNILIAADKDSIVARDTVAGDAGQFRFDATNTLILKQIRDKYCDMLEGAKLVTANTHAFIGSDDMKSVLIDTSNHTITGEDFCSISGVSALPVLNLPFKSGMIATQNFPYKEFFNVKLVVLLQSGLASRFNKHFGKEYANVDCYNFDQGGKLMEWQDLVFAYGVLIAGYIVSSGLCIFEKLFHIRNEIQISSVVPMYS